MDLEFKIPIENKSYKDWSAYAIDKISSILKDAIDEGRNKILISTNLKKGLPLENINKIAGPFVEAWAVEIFEDVVLNVNNVYKLIHVESGARLDMYDIIIQFKKGDKNEEIITSHVDSKATAEDIPNAGKSPNITSYQRIRSSYIEDPDFMFIVLSLNHKVYSTKDKDTLMTNGVMEVKSFHVYDIKYLSDKDISYNPALGTGQIQIRDINYVSLEFRDVWDFCKILDRKFIKSNGEEAFHKIASKNKWIK